jgi:hypothetical protein
MNKFVLMLLAASVTLGGTTLHLVHELRAERNSARRLAARVAELERATTPLAVFSALPGPLSAPVTESSTAAPAPATIPPPQLAAIATVGAISSMPADSPSRVDRMRILQENAARQQALLRDPDYRDAMRMQHKAMLAGSYPDLAEELDLTADELDRFMTLLADQRVRAQENQTMSFFDAPPDAAAVQEMQHAAQAWQQTVDQEIAALLGGDKQRAWKEYQSTLGVRHEVKQLRDSLASRGAPLRDDQVKPLQRALAEAQQQQMQEWSRNPPRTQLTLAKVNGGDMPSVAARLDAQEEYLQRQSEHQQRVRDSLASILTPEQLKYYEEQQDMQLKLQQAQLRIMRAQGEAEARGEIPPTPANEVILNQGVAVSSN